MQFANSGKTEVAAMTDTRKPSTEEYDTRRSAIIERREAGQTLATIAAVFGISNQRVHQIINPRPATPLPRNWAGILSEARQRSDIIADLAMRLHCDQATVRRAEKRTGIRLQRQRRRLPTNAILRLADGTRSASQIAEATGAPKSEIYKIVARADARGLGARLSKRPAKRKLP
jgi:hypothetical protein